MGSAPKGSAPKGMLPKGILPRGSAPKVTLPEAMLPKASALQGILPNLKCHLLRHHPLNLTPLLTLHTSSNV